MVIKITGDDPYTLRRRFAWLPRIFKSNGAKYFVWLEPYYFRCVKYDSYYTFQYQFRKILSDEVMNSSVE